MKNVSMAVSVMAALTLAGAARADKAKGGATLTAAADLKWADVPDMPGLKMVVLEGDPGKGPSHFMIKFPPGFAAKEHHHSANHYVTVISGTMTETVDGKEVKLPAGSYFAFTGKRAHLTACDAGAECVLSIDARGKWDVVPEKPATEAKKAEAPK